MLVFDFETGPQPKEELRTKWTPPDLSDLVATDFNPNDVKLGNLKDQAKIDEKMRASREAHEARNASLGQQREQRLQDSWRQFVDNAALSAVTGRIVAMGIYQPGSNSFDCCDGDEPAILMQFWAIVAECIRTNCKMCGHNILEFDLPFAIQRSWILGIRYPEKVIDDVTGKWPKWHSLFVDTRKVWLLGGMAKGSSFESLANAMGTTGKYAGLDGKGFHQLLIDDRETAMKYLEQDCRQPAIWLSKMGVF